ncbi:MAG: EscU/YscU/HrcU family type III secretion system export apparatus switch protein, partial [Candidatus Paceibacterota bacterium]
LREKILDFQKFDPILNLKSKFSIIKQEFLKLIISLSLLLALALLLPVSWIEAENYLFVGIPSIVAILLSICLLSFLSEIFLRQLELKKSLMMDSLELKNEQKEEQADPLLINRRQLEHRLLLLENMEIKVRNSKVIFINRY